jgi:hypothetical protein
MAQGGSAAKKDSKLPLVIGAVGLLLALGLVGGYFVFRGDGTPPPKTVDGGGDAAGTEDGADAGTGEGGDGGGAGGAGSSGSGGGPVAGGTLLEGVTIPPRPGSPLSPEQAEADGEALGEVMLSRASDLAYEDGRYEEAVVLLDAFPDWLEGASINKEIRAKRARYNKFAGFRKKLKSAVGAGKGSQDLRRAVLKIESNTLSDELMELPCVEEFKQDARQVLGPADYDSLVMEAADLEEVEDWGSSGLDYDD